LKDWALHHSYIVAEALSQDRSLEGSCLRTLIAVCLNITVKLTQLTVEDETVLSFIFSQPACNTKPV